MSRSILSLLAVCASFYARAATVTVVGFDSDAIAATIGKSQPGDAVFLPEGTYAVTKPVWPRSDTRLEGAGQDKTILRFAGDSSTVMVDLTGRERVEVCHLTLDGVLNPNAMQGISAGNARHLNIHHVTVRDLVKGSGFGPHGVLFSGQNPTRQHGVTDSVIADCRFENIGVGAKFGGGIRLAWGSSRNRVLHNVIDKTGRGGVFADNGSTDVVIRANVVSGSGGEGLGIEVWGGCDRAVIEDNRIDHWLSIGGCSYCAARRNVIRDTSGVYKFCGIEAIGSYLIITDNTVDGGAKIGLSVSSPHVKNYVHWERNEVRGCNQWGAQFQGESGGIAYHYLYQCRFSEMPVGVGPVWYPGDEGHGFRVNGNCRHVTFEECSFTDNGQLGVQFVGAGVDSLWFNRCTISGNKGTAVAGPGAYTALEWTDCTVSGNASDAIPGAKPFPTRPPLASFDVLDSGASASEGGNSALKLINTSTATDGELVAALWDLDAGPPVFRDLTKGPQEPVELAAGAPNPPHPVRRVTLVVWDSNGRAARAQREITLTP
jgi:hypothetical protein